MEIVTTDAVILREAPYKENDRILTILTPKYGIMTLLAKGVRNITSKNSPAVQLFCFSELELMKSGNRYTLKTAHLKDAFHAICRDLLRYSLACYVSDVIGTFCTGDNDETDAFRLVLNMFYALSNNPEKPVWLIKAAFELKLCSVCGFMPDFDVCGFCGLPHEEENDLNFKSGTKYLFSFSESALVCEKCRGELRTAYTESGTQYLPYTLAISPAAFEAARFVTKAEIARFVSFKLAESEAFDFCELCERYLLYQAERGFDTLKYYKSLL